jgi:TonB family protein
MKILLVISVVFLSLSKDVYSQMVDPFYVEGKEQLYKETERYLHYTDSAINNLISGVVYTSFTINERGEIDSVWIVKGAHELLDKEAIECVHKLGKWSPAMLDSMYIPTRINFPMCFLLEMTGHREHEVDTMVYYNHSTNHHTLLLETFLVLTWPSIPIITKEVTTTTQQIELRPNIQQDYAALFSTKGYDIKVNFNHLVDKTEKNYLAGYVVDEKDSIRIDNFIQALHDVPNNHKDFAEFKILPTLGEIYGNEKRVLFDVLFDLLSEGEVIVKRKRNQENLKKILIRRREKFILVETIDGDLIWKYKFGSEF